MGAPFHEVRFPTDISRGSSGGPGLDTFIGELSSGAEERVARRSSIRHRYDVAYAARELDKLYTVKEFYVARLGPAYGFRFKDFADFTSAPNGRGSPSFDDVEIAIGDGAATQFQLLKKYSSGGVVRTRTIKKPVSATAKVGLAGVEQLSGWTVNDTTGIVTFSSAPTNGVSITAGFEFDVPVRFGEEVDEFIDASIDAFDDGAFESIPLVEDLDPGEVQGEFFFGEAKAHGDVAADVAISLLEGRVHSLNPTSAGHSVILPETTLLTPGSPVFVLNNVSPTYNLTLKESGGSTITTFGPSGTLGSVVHVDLGRIVAGKEWIVS